MGEKISESIEITKRADNVRGQTIWFQQCTDQIKTSAE
jgi:hypothetical protein